MLRLNLNGPFKLAEMAATKRIAEAWREILLLK